MRTLVLALMIATFFMDLADPYTPFVQDPGKAQVYQTVTHLLYNMLNKSRPKKPIHDRPFIARLAMQYLRVECIVPAAGVEVLSFVINRIQSQPVEPFLNALKRPPISV